jgi:hypothetical protein
LLVISRPPAPSHVPDVVRGFARDDRRYERKDAVDDRRRRLMMLINIDPQTLFPVGEKLEKASFSVQDLYITS